MVDISRFIEDSGVFEPEATDAMARAFEEACIALAVFEGDQKGREIIATRVIELARSGVIDAAALRDRVIKDARSAA